MGISDYSDHNNYKPILAKGDDAERIIRNMNTYSEKFESVTFDQDGTLLLIEEDLKEN